MRVLTLCAAVAILWTSAPVGAHHCFAAEVDGKKPLTLRGSRAELEWVNPHGWLHVAVKRPDGMVESWAIEAGAPNALIRRALQQSDFPAGVEVVVEGFRAKNRGLKVNPNKVTFPDGRNFFLGAS